MAQKLSIPIRVLFVKTLMKWEIRSVKGDTHHDACLFAFPTFSPYTAKPKEIDAWACRDEFFGIPEGDIEKLRRFLENAGLFLGGDGDLGGHWSKEVWQHFKKGNPRPVDVGGLWKFRESLKRGLANQEAFKQAYAPLLTPLADSLEFPLSIEITDVVAGVLTVSDAYHALLATVFFDVARGVRFQVCEREDCKKPFPVTSEHERKFCTQYCGHLVSQRKKRAAKADGPSDKTALTVRQVAELTGFSRQTVIRMFEREPGVLVIPRVEAMHKRSYRSIRIPREVFERVRRRMSLPRN